MNRLKFPKEMKEFNDRSKFPESQTICALLVLSNTHPYGRDPHYKERDFKDETRDGPLVTEICCVPFAKYFEILHYDKNDSKINQRKWILKGQILDDLFIHLDSDLFVVRELGDLLTFDNGKYLFTKQEGNFLSEFPVINIKPPFGNAVLRKYKTQESHKNFVLQSAPAIHIYPVKREDYCCRKCYKGFTGDCYCDAKTQKNRQQKAQQQSQQQTQD